MSHGAKILTRGETCYSDFGVAVEILRIGSDQMLRLCLIIVVWILPVAGFSEDLDVGDLVFLKPDANATIDEAKVDVETVPVPAVVAEIDDSKVRIGRVWVVTEDVMAIDEALEFYSNQIQTDPKSSMMYVNRGRVYAVRAGLSQKREDFQKALADFDKAIELAPQNAKGFRGRGAVRLVQGEFDSGMRDLNESIRLDPRDARAYFNRSRAWIRKNQITSALNDCKEAIRLDPTDATYHVWAGELWSKKGDLSKAIDEFTEAIKLEPDSDDAYAHRGEARRLRREYASAIEDYSTAITIEPENAFYHYCRAVTHVENKQYQRAIDDVTESIRLDPKYPRSYSLRAGCWSQTGEYRKADEDLAEAIKLDAKHEVICNNFAWFKATCPDEQFRDGKLAMKYASKACESSQWKVSKYIGTLAAACAEAGDFASAVKWQLQANEIAGAQTKVAKERLALYRSKKPYRDVPRN